MPKLTARTTKNRPTPAALADEQQIDLEGRHLTVTTPDGTDYELGLSDDGHLQLFAPHGGTLFSMNAHVNVVTIVNWPLFQPVAAPTDERPVLASREHVMCTVGSKGGMSEKALEAAQAEIDNDPVIRERIEAAIHRAVTVKDRGYGAGTAVPRTDRHS